MAKKITGIDIREDSVYVVTLLLNRKMLAIETAESCPIPEDKDFPEGLADALAELAARMNFFDSACAVSLPATDTSFRVIELPFSEPKKIKQILKFEIEPSLAVPVDEVKLDFMPASLPGREGKSDILTCIIDRKKMSSYRRTFSGFRITTSTITARGFSIAALLTRSGALENGAFIDLDGKICTISLIHEKKIAQVRSVNIIGKMEAAAAVLELQRTIASLEDLAGTDFVLEKVVVSGAVGEAFVDRIGELLECEAFEVTPEDLSEKLNLESGSQPKNDGFINALALATAEAEGLASINFAASRSLASPMQFVENKKSLSVTAALLILLFGIFMFDILYSINMNSKRENLIKNTIASVFKSTFPEVKRIVDPVQQMKTKMDELGEKLGLSGAPVEGMKTLDLLNEISAGVPVSMGTEIQSIVISPVKIILSGTTKTFNNIDAIKNNLEKTGIFTAVTIGSANTDRSGKYVRFKLMIDFQ